MRYVKYAAVVIFLAMWGSLALYAQGVGASGEIAGVVKDPQGAVIAKASVQATDPAKNISRTVYTDSTGQYRFTSLPPSTYTITVKMVGFETVQQKQVTLTVGQSLALDFQLKVSAVENVIEVTSEPPLVETDRASQADTIEPKQIQNLPIDRRDYLEYTLLMPGVTDSRRVSGDADYRVVQTPQSGLSFYGSNGRGNNVTIDGGEANDDSGSVRPNVSQDAVQEFQINRSNYSAEFGAGSGAAINIVTKSGTNSTHGSIFGLFRNSALDSRSPFAITPALAPGQNFNPAAPDINGTPTKDYLNRQQFGGSIGFPITRDKSFMFLSYEGLRNDAQNTVPILDSTSIFRPTTSQNPILTALGTQTNSPVPCLTGQPALPSATCAAILTNILTINPASSPLNAYLQNIFEINGGLQPFNDSADYALVRFDHVFSSRNQLFIRYNFGRDDQSNPNVQALTAYSRGSKTNYRNHTVQANWFHQMSDNLSNEFRAQFGYANLDVTPNSQGGVGLDIPGYGNFARNIFLPDFSTMARPDFADNVTWQSGHHSVKFGGDLLLRYNRSESHTFMAGRFVFGGLPGGILSPCLQVPAACATDASSPLLTATPALISSLQSASLGLPQFYQQGFGNPTVSSWNPYPSAFFEDSWRAMPNLTLNFGLRYELDKRYAPLNTDYDNLAPRVSLAWDPWKDHKTVIRAGYGIFYSPTYYQIDYVVRALGLLNGNRQIANYFVPLTGEPGNPALTSAAIFQTLFAQNVVQCTTAAAGTEACITPANLTQFGINVTNTGPVPPLAVLFAGDPNYQNPMSQQAELSIEREITPGWSVSASFIHVHTTRLPIAIDTNLLPGAPIVNVPEGSNVYPVRMWNAPQCQVLVNNPCFANLLLLQNNVYTSRASALYNGTIFEVKKRFSSHYMIMGSYTYSHASDNSTDYNSDYAPFDQTNLAGENGASDFDQRHKLVIMGVFETPWTGSSAQTVAEKIFADFTFSPTFRYNSGRPFNLLAGTDVNGDRHSTNDRPIGVGRNTGIGPNYASFDVRVQRRFKLNERANLNFIMEAFNLFDRTNWASVNNTVGPNFLALSPTPRVHGSNIGASNPLGFSSAYPMREFQLGVRLNF